MQPDLDPYQQQRSACLPWMLGLFTIGFFGVLLSVATGGFFVYVVGVLGAVVGITALHYALWGRMLDESVAAEREEEDEREFEDEPLPRRRGASDQIRRRDE